MSTSTPTGNYFAALSAINVNEHVEKKGGFSYLSWPYAVAQLRMTEPTATWEVKRFGDLPFLATEAGVFVEVAVTVQGVTLSQIHPVLDHKNRHRHLDEEAEFGRQVGQPVKAPHLPVLSIPGEI